MDDKTRAELDALSVEVDAMVTEKKRALLAERAFLLAALAAADPTTSRVRAILNDRISVKLRQLF